MLRETGRLQFVDVTEQAGLAFTGYGMGVAVGDYNNDGYPDLYVTNFGSNILYRNNGNGTFTNVAKEAGVEDGGWSTSASFVDYDRDGLTPPASATTARRACTSPSTTACSGTSGTADSRM
jgi:hypothetical protein